MRRIGEGSWRIGVRRWDHLIDCALWIRPLGETPEAIRYLRSGQACGKVVITV